MKFTTAASTTLAAVAIVQAGCVPVLHCHVVLRSISHPHAPNTRDTDSNNDFSHAFEGCLQKDNTVITQNNPTTFKIASKNGGDFNNCTSIVNSYKSSGETHGKLIENTDGSFEFSPIPADLPTWTSAVKNKSS